MRHAIGFGFVLLLFGCGGSKRDSISAVSGASPIPAASPMPAATPDAGGSSNPCDGLRPGPPDQPVTFKETLAISQGAMSPLGDGQGNVLIGTAGGFGQLGYSIHAPDGGVLGSADFPPSQTASLTVPLASGFAGIIRLPFMNGPSLIRMTPDGGIQNAAAANEQGHTAADPRGGLVLLTADALTSYDDDLSPRFTVPLQLTSVGLAQLGVDVTGNILVLFAANVNAGMYDQMGFWVDRDGHQGTAFPVEEQLVIDENIFALAPDVRGGLFLWHSICDFAGTDMCTSQWERRFPPLSTSPEPAPEWLASRGGATTFPLVGPTPKLELIHGQSGYALTGVPQPACGFEVVTADGVSCGVIDFSSRLSNLTSSGALLIAKTGGHPACHSSLDVGRDGTVLSTSTVPCIDNDNCPVSYDWFPGYFR